MEADRGDKPNGGIKAYRRPKLDQAENSKNCKGWPLTSGFRGQMNSKVLDPLSLRIEVLG